MLEKISGVIERIFEFFCGFTIVALVCVVAAQVAFRVLKISIPWAEELARFLMIWLTFAGCSLAIRRKGHLSVDFFVNLAPEKLKTVIGIVTRGIIMVFFALLVVYGIRLSLRSINTLSSTLQWSMGLVYSVLPVCSLASIYFVALDLAAFLKGRKTA
jgi:TRAP-type C4-dicarboxylate transport system permease small subunit